MGRAPCCDKANVKRGPWSPEEDAKLKEYIEKYGTGSNWISLPQKAGLKRCGKSCRLRWLNYLRPNIKHGEFSDEEDRIICTLYASIGSRWSIIAAQLPGRTDNDIKNYWNTKLKKKLMGITNTNKKSSSSSSTYHHHHNQIQIQYPMLNHQPSSSSSSSLSPSLSSSSPYQCTSTAYYNSPSSNTMSFSAFDHHHQVKDNNTLLMFGGDQAACSTSDGSNCYTSINNNNNNHHQVIIKCEDQGINIMQQNYDANFCNNQDHQEGKLLPSGNSCNNTSVLDYGLEEIKQLISTNINVGNIFNYSDESKLMYYY